MNRRSPTLALAFAILPLAAQAPSALKAVHAAHQDPFGPAAPVRLVVLVEATGPSPAEGWRALLATPTLLPFQIPLDLVPLRSPAGAELVTRFALPLRASWVLLAAREDRLLSRGEALPEAAAFAATLKSAGVTDPTRALRTYLKAFPDVLEARERLLALLRRRAEVDVLSRGTRPLSPESDLAAWGPFAQELDVLFRTGRWRESAFAWLQDAHPLDGGSPTLRSLYTRWRPEVEAALRRQPENGPFWQTWIWMSRALEDHTLHRLLASLAPTPLSAPGDWPPEDALRALREAAHTPGDWQELQAPYRARWEQARPTGPGQPGAPGQVQRRDLAQQDWDERLAPLLEACLRGDAKAQADALVREAYAARLWPDLHLRAAALARRCGAADLADAWGALGGGRP